MQLDLRGTDLATMKSYIELLGGVEQEGDRFVGEGWAVRLVAGIHRYRNWEFPRVLLTFEGRPERVAEVVGQLRIMAMRGGG
ncbi:MAG: hypothetical protein ACOY93_11775 [Bacillota bacterium]